MKLRSLEELSGSIVDGKYIFDLTEASFSYSDDLAVFEYTVPKLREMRIDLISYDLYLSTDYTDFLLWMNNIINPLNIREGDKIFFVSSENIARFYAPKENEEEVQEIFLNASKTQRKDKNRDKFIDNKRAALPPTVNESKNEQVKIKGDSIIIGGDIFNV